MGKIQKKGKAGAAINFITRSQAVKKLQISLADFRRLCILKGIYPREPKNKKKANKGSTAPTTFYYTKDIQYLLHEPVLQKFREYKTFARKLSKVLAQGQYSTAKVMEENKPVYTLDHIIKERYPTFTDAIRDLDDALCMLFLFATMPTTEKVKANTISNCQRLTAEFQHYVMHSRSLRKAFLSIKGIYYQADIKGQTVTWLVPYQFAQTVPTDVDFRVMLTFLEFYQTLVGFVNFKLFNDVNLVYPPKLDAIKEAGAVGLNALVIEAINHHAALGKNVEASQKDEVEDGEKANPEEKIRLIESEKRLETLSQKLAHIQENSFDSTPQFTADDEATLDEFKPAAPTLDDSIDSTTITLHDIQSASTEISSLQSLFSKCVIFLSRETPRHSLEFVIRSLGGQVAWEPSTGAGSPYAENDERITHQILDRPTQGHRFLSRNYAQPQWIYDCVNARKVLRTDAYEPGKTLPPHLSPFVETKEGDYVPSLREGKERAEEEAFEGETEEMEAGPKDEGMEKEDDDDDEEDEDEDDERAVPEQDDHQLELEAEAAGIPFTEYQQQQAARKKKQAKKEIGTPTKSVDSKKRTAKDVEEEEAKEMAKIMMTKRQKKLYTKIQYGKDKKAAEVANLKRKKQEAMGDKARGVQAAKKMKQ